MKKVFILVFLLGFCFCGKIFAEQSTLDQKLDDIYKKAEAAVIAGDIIKGI